MSDILNFQPAKPATIFPGRWLIDLPSLDTAIQTRRYTASSQHTSASLGSNDLSGPSGYTILEKLKEDPLERCWRTINRDNDGHSHSTNVVRNVLMSGNATCGVIATALVNDRDSERNEAEVIKRRELWVFSVGEGAEENMDLLTREGGLEEITPRLPILHPKQLISCPHHGNDLSCLQRIHVKSRATRLCEVRFDPSIEDRLVWERFTTAIVEKVIWNQGHRVNMGVERPPIKASLYPLPGSSLLLKIVPPINPAPSSAPQTDPNICQLLPLRIPAILVSSHQVDDEDIMQLNNSFEAALGREWKKGQSSMRIDRQIRNEPFSEYSVYWVPTSALLETDFSLAYIDNPSEWRKSKGVVTVWPTHLTTHSERSQRVVAKKRSLPIVLESSTNAELMNTASSLFDFLSSYKVPEPEGDALADDVAMDDGGDIVFDEEPEFDVDANTPMEMDRPINQDSDGKDDLEDLFSSSSHEDTPLESLQLNPFEPKSQPQSDVNSALDLFETTSNGRITDFDDIVMASSPPEERRQSLPVLSNPDGNEVEVAMVTEDDFDFFDSPSNDIHGENIAEDERLDTHVEQDEMKKTADEPLPKDDQVPIALSPLKPEMTSSKADETAEVAGMKDEQQQPVGARRKQEDDSPALWPTVEAQSVRGAKSEVNPEKQRPTVAFKLPTPEHQPSIERPSGSEIIPSPFEPIDLPSSGTTFAYSLPSPALTPEALRSDLIERLKPPQNKKTFDYTAAWNLDTPPSEDEDEEYTGPPTPETDTDFDFDSIHRHTPTIPSRDSDEAAFDGMPCVGSEWVSLIGQHAFLEQLGRPWNSAWDTGSISPTDDPPPLKTGLKSFHLPNINTHALAKELISNRSFRRRLSRHSQQRMRSRSSSPSRSLSLDSDGIALADIATKGESTTLDVSPSTVVNPCHIHIGFAGNVTKISIASLQFWREIGLQPISGPKNIRLLVIVDAKEAVRETCKHYLDSFQSAYQLLNLGSVRMDERAGNSGLVMRDARSSDFITHASRLILDCTKPNSVIQVVVDDTLPWVKQILSPSISPITPQHPTIVVQILPLSVIRQTDHKDLALEAYNRIPRQIKRVKFPHPIEYPAPYFQYPTFTLAPEEPPKPKLTLSLPIRSFDVFGTWRDIHLAYGVKGGWLVMFVIDTEGDNWEVHTSRCDNLEWDERVDVIRIFGEEFAGKAAIEWRLSVTALGRMEVEELQAWKTLFLTKTYPITILCLDDSRSHTSTRMLASNRPRVGPPNAPAPIYGDPNTRIIDDTLTGHTLELIDRQPISLKSQGSIIDEKRSFGSSDEGSYKTIYTESSFLISMSTGLSGNQSYISGLYHILNYRPPPGKEDENIGTVLGKEFYRIGCLIKARFGLGQIPNPNSGLDEIGISQELSFIGHLGIVSVVLDGFEDLAEMIRDQEGNGDIKVEKS